VGSLVLPGEFKARCGMERQSAQNPPHPEANGASHMMRKSVTWASIFFLSTLSAYASQSRAGNPSQFNVPKLNRRNLAALRARVGQVRGKSASGPYAQPGINKVTGNPHVPAANQSNNPSAALGFVSARQVPTGGSLTDNAAIAMGDFNGDGKNDCR